MHPNGIKSKLGAAIRFGGRCHGILCLEHVRQRHAWRQDEIDFACSIASHLAAALESLARAEAEARARERTQFSLALIEGSPVGIQVFARDGTSQRMNAAMQQLLGLPSSTCDTGSYNLLHDPEVQRTGLDRWFLQALEGKPTRIARHEVDFTRPEAPTTQRRREKFWLESVFFPLLDDASEVEAVVAFSWEVTERVTAERDQERLSEQLRQAQKLEAVGRLAGGIAHDFNNLLTGVIGYADLLQMQTEAVDPRRELVDQIRAAADRGVALTKQLMAFGRVGITKVETFDAGEAVVDLLPMMRRLLEASIDLDLRREAVGPIACDPGYFQQVLVSLLLNAREAMPNGGKIRIALSPASLANGKPAVRLSIADTGVGMNEETRARAFEPFFSTKSGSSTGLGLATVHGIVTDAGGSVSVESQLGVGSKIDIVWPEAEDDRPLANATVDDEQLRARAGETVLVVEDDDTNRALAARMLRHYGYRVLTAPDGQDALEIAAGETRIDLLLTDVVMPGIGGRALAEEMTRQRAGLPVVFASGYTTDDALRHGVEGDEIRFLPKPYSATQLAAIVRQTLDN